MPDPGRLSGGQYGALCAGSLLLLSPSRPSSDEPVVIALKGGHHVYVNAAGLERLGIDDKTRIPKAAASGVTRKACRPVCSSMKRPDVLKRVADSLSAEEIAHAVLAAERLAFSFGITAIADNTFAPSHLAKMPVRFDAGFTRDGRGIFFKFGEAFQRDGILNRQDAKTPRKEGMDQRSVRHDLRSGGRRPTLGAQRPTLGRATTSAWAQVFRKTTVRLFAGIRTVSS